MKSDSLVIIPTYNEKENISNIINAVLGVTERGRRMRHEGP